ncbi:MAG TPA: diacylglycerol kinase family protein [Egibacteraceae bacterium]|nr:diacylglycerol kinase family protein [Egibacteraceae bacterium]
MSSPFGPMRLIVNPRAGRHEADLKALTDGLAAQGLDFDEVRTTGPGSAERLAREALEEGIRYLVAVGGDGTVHEVVNGMVADDKPVNPDAVLGVYAAGSGCDFIRTFGLNRAPDVVARHFATDHVMPIDVGVAELTGPDGRPLQRYFANIAEVGYGAEAVRRAAGYPRWLGKVRYLFAAWGAVRGVNAQQATIELEGKQVDRNLVNLVAANCQFFGGGMKVAPRALPDDGIFNVQIFHGAKSQVFQLTSKIYKGEHIPHPGISEFQSPWVAVAPDEPMLVEADGEVLGTTPVRFRLLQRAIQLKL